MNEPGQPDIPLPLFLAGHVVATTGALRLLNKAGRAPIDFVTRHTWGDWSEMPAADQIQNALAVRDGHRVMSSYRVGPEQDAPRVWVITESDRRITTVLRPEDY